jgi:hypothetical protein
MLKVETPLLQQVTAKKLLVGGLVGWGVKTPQIWICLVGALVRQT